MTLTPKPQGWNVRGNRTVTKPATSNPKVNLRHVDFDDLVKQQGVRVKVYRSSFCPRVKSIDGAEHEIDCPICYGAQYVDLHPVCTYAFLQGINLDKGVFVEGLYDGNSLQATFLQDVELQYFTLVELVDHTEIYYERIKRQTSNTDALKYHAQRVNFILDYNNIEYYEGSDFCLDANGSVRWEAGKGPAAGIIYTIHYERNIRFRAEKALHANRFAQVDQGGQALMVKMNEQWVLVKDYLVERKDQDGNPLPPNNIND